MIDLIYRQAAIDEFYMDTCDVDKVEWAETVLKRVPTAERKGHWEKIHWKAFRCSECRHINESYTTYCPNCGIRNGELTWVKFTICTRQPEESYVGSIQKLASILTIQINQLLQNL